jgi:hypothetical protein
MKAPVNLDITRKGRIEWLSPRCDPVQDGAFQALGVVRSSTCRTLLDLRLCELGRRRIHCESAYQVSDEDHLLLRTAHNTFLQPWYHLEQLRKNLVFPSLPGGRYNRENKFGKIEEYSLLCTESLVGLIREFAHA